MLPEIGLFLAFGAGLISFFSPCVAPLVPGYLSFISGLATAAPSGKTVALAGRRSAVLVQTVIASAIFVLGFTLVFVLLGASAALFGGLLDTYRQSMNRITGLLMIVMGLILADIVRIPSLNQDWRIHLDGGRLGPSAPLLLGMTFAFGWAPCVGPILAGILLYAGSAATVGTGIWLLFAYSIGLGIPFMISGVAATWMLGATRRLRRFWPWITRLSGAVLVGVGLLFVSGRFFYLSIAMQRLYYTFFY